MRDDVIPCTITVCNLLVCFASLSAMHLRLTLVLAGVDCLFLLLGGVPLRG